MINSDAAKCDDLTVCCRVILNNYFRELIESQLICVQQGGQISEANNPELPLLKSKQLSVFENTFTSQRPAVRLNLKEEQQDRERYVVSGGCGVWHFVTLLMQ